MLNAAYPLAAAPLDFGALYGSCLAAGLVLGAVVALVNSWLP